MPAKGRWQGISSALSPEVSTEARSGAKEKKKKKHVPAAQNANSWAVKERDLPQYNKLGYKGWGGL